MIFGTIIFTATVSKYEFKLSKYEFKLSKYEFKLSKQWRTLREILGEGGGGGGGEIFNMYTFGVRLRYANLSNIVRV